MRGSAAANSDSDHRPPPAGDSVLQMLDQWLQDGALSVVEGRAAAEIRRTVGGRRGRRRGRLATTAVGTSPAGRPDQTLHRGLDRAPSDLPSRAHGSARHGADGDTPARRIRAGASPGALSADKAVDMVRAAHPAHGAAALHWLQSFIVGPALLAGLSDTAKPQDQQSTGHRGARRADRLYLHPQLRRAPTGRDLRPRTDPPFSRWRLPKFADKLNEKGWLMDSFGMGVDLVPRRRRRSCTQL